MMKIEDMKEEMINAGVYSKEDIDEICNLEQAYLDECAEIEEDCIAEGYPANGSNYELRCAEARKYYDEEITVINEKYMGV